MSRISFEGRAVIVTGAGGGLGRSYALELARRGAQVLVNDLGGALDGSGASSKPADHVVDEIHAIGGIAAASYDSVASPAGGRRIVEACLDAYGRLDAVVNNAGNLRYAFFDELDDESVEALVGTHLLGAFHVSRPAFRAMKAAGYGRFVFTSSAAGLFGNAQQAHYAAAKAGVLGLMNAVAIEGEAHGIAANCILPVAHTRMSEGTDPSRIRPQDAARMAGIERLGSSGLGADFVTPLVVFLASDACALSQQAFSAAWGRYARVFVGVTRGWYGPRGVPASAEDVRDHLPEIGERSRYFTPCSVYDEAGTAIEELPPSRTKQPPG
jgi:NAD(P)-dependent dehydrogenase (short-subunit alcohol dehydrogenase family)